MKLFFVTFTTHNSRISKRMATYTTNSFINNLIPVTFTGNDYTKMLELISEAIRKHQLNVYAFTVIPDHVHLLIEATDQSELSKQINKIKGSSAYLFNRYKDHDKGSQLIWSQKFHHKEIPINIENIYSVINYIKINPIKHAERWGNETIKNKTLIDELNNQYCKKWK